MYPVGPGRGSAERTWGTTGLEDSSSTAAASDTTTTAAVASVKS